MEKKQSYNSFIGQTVLDQTLLTFTKILLLPVMLAGEFLPAFCLGWILVNFTVMGTWIPAGWELWQIILAIVAVRRILFDPTK